MPQSRDGQAQEKKIEQGTKSQKFFAVEVDPVKSEDTRDTIPVIGRLVALQSGEISALVSAPIKRTLVTVGDRVKKGDTLCIIEAMKLLNEIESDKDGVIKAILFENGQPVEFGEPLFIIS